MKLTVPVWQSARVAALSRGGPPGKGIEASLARSLRWEVRSGPPRGAADLLGLVIVTVAVLKSEGSAEARCRAVPQAAWRWHG